MLFLSLFIICRPWCMIFRFFFKRKMHVELDSFQFFDISSVCCSVKKQPLFFSSAIFVFLVFAQFLFVLSLLRYRCCFVVYVFFSLLCIGSHLSLLFPLQFLKLLILFHVQSSHFIAVLWIRFVYMKLTSCQCCRYSSIPNKVSTSKQP